MDLLSGINLYSMQSGQVNKILKKTLCNGEEITEKTEINAQKTNQMSSKDILGFMANQAVAMKVDVSKTIQIKKLTSSVSAEEYERIGNMMKDFENNIEQGLQTLNGEFPDLKLSENSKLKLVLQSMDKTSF